MKLADEDPTCTEAVNVLAVGTFGVYIAGFVVRKVHGDKSVAEDLGQDIWRRVWKARGTWRPRTPIDSANYVFTVAVNIIKDHRKAEARRTKAHREIAAELIAAQKVGLPTEVLIDLRNGLSRLEHDDRYVIEETVMNGRTNGDLAAELGISEDAVKKRRERALSRLRSLL